MAMPGLSTPTRSTEIAVFTNTPYVSRLRPKHRQPRAFLAEAPFLCASAKNRCGLRVDRLFPPPPFRFLHATFAMLRWHGATFRLHSQTIFGDYIPAFPDTAPASRGRAASIPSPTRNLRLLFRAVDAMPPLSILRSAQADNLRAPPTHRGSCHCHSVRRLPFIYRLRRYARPDMRCADALTPLRLSANHFTHSESAYGLGQGQVGLLSAVQAPQQKACRSVPTRHLPFALILCRHYEFPPFLWLTYLRYAPHRHHRTSPHQSPRLDKSAPRKSERCRKGQFPRCGNLTFTAAILPRNRVAPWGCFCIFREGERGQDENKRARWGVCKATTGASPRNPQLPHSSVVPSRNPLQIRGFCRTGPARDGKFA